MKVLIVSRALLASSYRHKLVELARLGVDVTAVVPTHWREGASTMHLEPGNDAGYRIVETPIRWSGHFHAHYYPQLQSLLHSMQPQIVHLDEEPYNFATFLGARNARAAGLKSLFFTWQNINRSYPIPFRNFEHAVYTTVSGAFAGTDEAAAVLRQKGFARTIFVVPQFGVDVDTFQPGTPPTGPFTVGFLNRLVEGKGAWVALDALALLPEDVHMKIVGDGPLRSDILARIEHDGLASRVDVAARVPSREMPSLLRGLHAVLLPSLTTPRWKEQFGRIAVEAMACGVPVVGSDSGEIPRVLADAGLIVPEGDAHALSSAILRLYSDSDLRVELIRRGRRRVLERYTNAQVALASEAAYRQLLRAD